LPKVKISEIEAIGAERWNEIWKLVRNSKIGGGGDFSIGFANVGALCHRDNVRDNIGCR
jgi:hypothetical protein